MNDRNTSVSPWLVIAASVLFLVHAASYLYFFVDDEAIPFVYAQNLLKGLGLSYNGLEGRLEGYSDFLHVFWAAVTLSIVRLAGLPKHSVFFVGKAVSIVSGVEILLLVAVLLRRSRTHAAGAITALGTVALAGPLALWSCSSLESVPFAFISAGLLVALVTSRDGWAAIAASLLVLERIDGFVYASVLVGAFLLTASDLRRREMVRRIAAPLCLVLIAYHGWRWWYFEDLVPAPVETKILYKLLPHQNVVVKAPERSYGMQFIGAYGWPAALALCASAIHAVKTGGWIRTVTFGALLLAVYVSVVGDWMFGFRFFVPLLPLFALIVANAVDHVASLRPRLGSMLCAAIVVYGAYVAVQFAQTYEQVEKTPSFLRHPSPDLHQFFWPYYGLYETARHSIFPGDIVAYNQAGFVPFMLDVNNIDDPGICSRFPADVPSTDIYFTEVGRYAPLTNQATLRPVHQYFLYQKVHFVMSRTDILLRANNDTVPPALFGGLFHLVGEDAQQLNAIYERTENTPVSLGPDSFTENVAHVSYVRAARLNGSRIDSKDYLRTLPFLRDEAGIIEFAGHTELLVEFSDQGERVNEIRIAELRASVNADVQIRLVAPDHEVVGKTDVMLAPGEGQSVLLETAGAIANRLVLTIDAPGEGALRIRDLRVVGQRSALREYVTRNLRFSKENQDYLTLQK